MRTPLLFALALCCSPALAQPATDRCSPAAADAARADVRTVLEAQAAAWNAGDLDRYMAGYARTDSLRFASGGNVRQGWESALAAYRAGYPDAATMGHLTFSAPGATPGEDGSPVRITPLCEGAEASPRWALAFGRWHLARDGERPEDAPHGLFTLLVERRAEGWRVVHDHTSSARKPSPAPEVADTSDLAEPEE